MKRLAIYCVNYASYGELVSFLSSVQEAAQKAKEVLAVDVFVADNTDKDAEPIHVEKGVCAIRIFLFHENLGYMGAVQRMMALTDISIYDYVAISNVDLILDKDSLLAMADLDLGNNVGWIAPRLFSAQLGYDRNPSVLLRYSKRHLQLLRLMFSYPWICVMYKKTFYKRKKFHSTYREGLRFYAGHGSFMILTREYFNRCGIPTYPVFLFGEELYLAEKCKSNGLSVVYCPSISLWDKEHVSIGGLRKPAYYCYNVSALSYILETFYSSE